jgi:hypothetical protein
MRPRLHRLACRLAWLGWLAWVAIGVPPASAQSSDGASGGVRHYRYEILTRAQDFAYATEVSPDVAGRHYAVETDAQGRIVRTTVMRNGRKLTERVYTFGPSGKAPIEYTNFSGSEKGGSVRVQRNPAGNRTREEYFTASGVPTGYTVFTYRPEVVEVASYAADGKRRSIELLSYSSNNTLSRSVTYSNPDDRSFHVDTEYDDKTGLRTATTQYEGGVASTSGSFTYDENGDLARQDMYDPAGQWFAAALMADGLTTKRLYDSSKELRYRYDERRRLQETELFFEDRLVCRFTYERLSNGSARRTLAHGPDGKLWAEYPDMEVVDVRQNGQPINGRPAVMHRTGNWY